MSTMCSVQQVLYETSGERRGRVRLENRTCLPDIKRYLCTQCFHGRKPDLSTQTLEERHSDGFMIQITVLVGTRKIKQMRFHPKFRALESRPKSQIGHARVGLRGWIPHPSLGSVYAYSRITAGRLHSQVGRRKTQVPCLPFTSDDTSRHKIGMAQMSVRLDYIALLQERANIATADDFRAVPYGRNRCHLKTLPLTQPVQNFHRTTALATQREIFPHDQFHHIDMAFQQGDKILTGMLG